VDSLDWRIRIPIRQIEYGLRLTLFENALSLAGRSDHVTCCPGLLVNRYVWAKIPPVATTNTSANQVQSEDPEHRIVPISSVSSNLYMLNA